MGSLDRPPLPEVLRLGGFRRYVAGSLLLTTATLMQEVVIGYRLFELTGDPLALGLVGLAEVLPILVFGLYAGHYADGHRKLPIMRAALIVILMSSVCLAWAYTPMGGAPALPTAWLAGLTYLALGFVGLARAFYNPAGFALKTALVPPRLYGRAAAWSSSAWQIGAVAGPALGGVALAVMGSGATLLGVTLLVAVVIGLQAGIIEPPQATPIKEPVEFPTHHPSDPSATRRISAFRTIWLSLREGLSFVLSTKPILYAISLDLFSVLFGGVIGILPVFALQVLHTGPEGLGILRAAPGVGSIIVLLLLTRYAPKRRVWSKLLGAVMGFGLATIGFALSESLWLSAFLLLLTGGFDAVSVVIRSTLLQTLTPPPLRGRVAAVNGLFVSTSNELGAFESGLAARLLGPVPSVLVGGAVTLVVVGIMWLTGRDLRRTDPQEDDRPSA